MQELISHDKSCGIIIFTDSAPRKYLLIQQLQTKIWGFPKGHVEEPETEEETAIREVLEETGISVRILEGFRESVQYHTSPDVLKTVVMFIGVPLTSEIRIQPEEICDHAWLTYDEAMKRMKFKNSRELLEKAETFINKSRIESNATSN